MVSHFNYTSSADTSTDNHDEPTLYISNVEKPVDYPRYWVKIKINDQQIFALVDTGAARTTIGSIYSKLLDRNGTSLKLFRFKHAQMANGQVEPICGELQTRLAIADVVKPVSLIVLPNLAVDLIFGIDLIRLFKMDILGSCDMFTLAESSENKKFHLDLWEIEISAKYPNIASVGLAKTTPEQKAMVEELLDKIIPPPPKNGILPATNLVEHDIKLKENAVPLKQRYYPVSDKLLEVMERAR